MSRVSYILALCLTVAFMLIGQSCYRDPISNRGNPHIRISYPASIGMYWVYEVSDSLTGSLDTVYVSVVDTATMNDGRWVQKWKYNHVQYVANTVTSVSADTIELGYNDAYPLMTERFVMPFYQGAIWGGPVTGDDTSWVAEIGAITVPAGTFSEGVCVERVWGRDFEGGGNFSRVWLVSGVGMVFRYEYATHCDGSDSITTASRTWRLIHYNLDTFDLRQYPNNIAWYWKYQVEDSASGSVDTVTVRITGTATLGNGRPAKVWVYSSPHYLDTQYIATVDDRVEVFTDREVGLMYAYYEFPLAIGRYWDVLTFVPHPDIIDKAPISVPAGDFRTAFNYTHAQMVFNHFWAIDAWLVPNVGMVRQTIHEFCLGPVTTTRWELIEFGYPPD